MGRGIRAERPVVKCFDPARFSAFPLVAHTNSSLKFCGAAQSGGSVLANLIGKQA